jgi:hypothetical protein
MTHIIQAVFVSGVFRPLEPVNLAEGTRADVILLPQSAPNSEPESLLADAWPSGYFEQTAGALVGEEFERPPQGELPQRDDW